MDISTRRAALIEFGLPHVIIYESGECYDSYRDQWKTPCKRGHFCFYDTDGREIRIMAYRLLNFYFAAPWNRPIYCRWRRLDFVGCPDYFVTSLGEIYCESQCVYYKPVIKSTGYCQVTIRSTDGTYKVCLVHRLVAQAFIPNPENKLMVNHLDGIKTNNNVFNLEWATSRENNIHMFETGLHPKSLSDAVAHEICKRLERGDGMTKISKELHVSYDSVNSIKNKGFYSYISKDYKW